MLKLFMLVMLSKKGITFRIFVYKYLCDCTHIIPYYPFELEIEQDLLVAGYMTARQGLAFFNQVIIAQW